MNCDTLISLKLKHFFIPEWIYKASLLLVMKWKAWPLCWISSLSVISDWEHETQQQHHVQHKYFPYNHGEQWEHPTSSSFYHWEVRHWLENRLIEERNGLPSWGNAGGKKESGGNDMMEREEQMLRWCIYVNNNQRAALCSHSHVSVWTVNPLELSQSGKSLCCGSHKGNCGGEQREEKRNV